MAKPKPIVHGTRRGYEAHAYRGEYACKPCTDANTEYARTRAGQDLRRRRARRRAVNRLMAEHPQQFAALMREETSRG